MFRRWRAPKLQINSAQPRRKDMRMSMAAASRASSVCGPAKTSRIRRISPASRKMMRRRPAERPINRVVRVEGTLGVRKVAQAWAIRPVRWVVLVPAILQVLREVLARVILLARWAALSKETHLVLKAAQVVGILPVPKAVQAGVIRRVRWVDRARVTHQVPWAAPADGMPKVRKAVRAVGTPQASKVAQAWATIPVRWVVLVWATRLVRWAGQVAVLVVDLMEAVVPKAGLTAVEARAAAPGANR